MSKRNGEFRQNCAYAYQTDPENEPGRLLMQFEGQESRPGDYLILDTDYENYAVHFGCKENFDLTAVTLTREDHPDSLFVSNIKKEKILKGSLDLIPSPSPSVKS